MTASSCKVGKWVMWGAQFPLLIFLAFPLSAGDSSLAGLWESKVIHGPAVQGRLLVRKVEGELLAEIGGRQARVRADANSLSFRLSDGSRFEGQSVGLSDIRGHWFQPPSKLDGNVFATPVHLQQEADIWIGEVTPQPDTATFYLLLEENAGEWTSELINPERNLGVFQNLSTFERRGSDVLLMGKFRGRGEEQIMLRGTYHEDEDILAVRYPGRGGNYDFRRAEPGGDSGFLAREGDSELVLRRPVPLADGWETATAIEVGIDENHIVELIKSHILPAPNSTHDLSVHALLIARNGKLVVEEYFHGYHRDLPHDSRSASKSVTAILAAATMFSGAGLDWDTAVYPVFGRSGESERGLQRELITLRHLVNMNSGLDCDDRNPESAAQEDRLWDNAQELDFYQHTLDVDIVHAPGEVAAYCSASSNLAGGVIEAAAGEPLLSLIDRLLARPLGITRYSIPIPPDGHPYMGGGARWLARDFLKFPQLLLNGGTWNGTRVISELDAKRLVTPEVKIDSGRDYGYLWWTEEYEYEDRTIRAHFMGGNGGQIAMLVPALDLSIVFNAGNYSDRVMFRIQQELIPDYILPAVTQ